MMLILPICEYGMSFHLFVPSSISSLVSYNFPSTGLLSPWLGLLPGIFILFEAIVNGTIFLISLSISSLFAY